MRMVAAAKVRKAEQKMRQARPYTQSIASLLTGVMEGLLSQGSELKASRYYRALVPHVPQKRIALVIISSDRGLCGAYNANILRESIKRIDALKHEGKALRLFVVGNKALQVLSKRYPAIPILGRLSGVGVEPSYTRMKEFSTSILDTIEHDQVDAVEVLYTQFRSMVSYKVVNQPLFPLTTENVEQLLPSVSIKRASESMTSAIPSELAMVPSPAGILDGLIPLFLSRVIYACLLESIASELASRMTAMANASDNAKAVIHKLSLQYNKARQAAITQEIMEIVGGANALAD